MKSISSTAMRSALVNYSSDSESDLEAVAGGQAIDSSLDPMPTTNCALLSHASQNMQARDPPITAQDQDRDRPLSAMSLLPRSDLSALSVPNGQWPVHVHVPLGPLPDRLSELIDKVLIDARQFFPTLRPLVPLATRSTIQTSTTPLHVSLSRAGTWLPRAHLATCVSMIQTDLAHQRPVHVQFGRVSHLMNDVGLRRFLVLECTAGQVGLARWLRVVNQVLEKQLGRKPFYEKPRFHVSIGYVDLGGNDGARPGDEGQDHDQKRWDDVADKLTSGFGPQLAGCVVSMARVEIWTGEQAYKVDLIEG